nr:MAG TPA: tail collar fiber protein [Caudoviricetes sp.]
MASIKRTGITDKGKDLITREIAGITELTFTKISASSNKLADTVNLETLINIDGVKQTVNVSKVEKIGTSQIKVTATFNNSGLMNGYGMETLGIYAKDTAGTEVLFAVTVAGTSDYMPATNGINLSTVTVELIFNLSNTDNVSLSVDTAALVTAGMFDSFKSEVNKDYVKYTDLAEENKAGIITYAKIKEIAPRPDLSPYIPFSKGYRNSNDSDWVVRTNGTDTWISNHLYMYSSVGAYTGGFHTNGGRAYYKVPGRNGDNWCEIMDHIDMAVRDNRMNGMDNDRADLRGHINRLWTARDTDTVLNIRLAGYIQAEVQRNEMRERNGYVVTGGINDDRNYTLDYLQFRALQMYRAGNWVNVPFV